MKFKNQFGKREETSDGCLTQVETSKIKRDREERKTKKKEGEKQKSKKLLQKYAITHKIVNKKENFPI